LLHQLRFHRFLTFTIFNSILGFLLRYRRYLLQPNTPGKQPSAILLRFWHTHPGLPIALLVYLMLAFSYFFIVPMFEAPDEWTHTGYIKHIAEGQGLPMMLPGQGIWGGHQPPLYYAIGAVLVQPFDLSQFDAYLRDNTNPHASVGYALDPGNKNIYLHQPDETFPYRGLSLTVHVLRLYSIFLGTITIIFIYLTAYELYKYTQTNPKSKIQNPNWFAVFVTLFVATQPMFAFITASVANEPANIAFSAIGLWLVQRYVLHGPARRWYRPVALGVVMGLIALSKMTGLSFGLVIAVAFLQTAITRRKQPGVARLLWRDCIIIGTLFLAVAGWWYWRNYHFYGDFFQRGLYETYFHDKLKPLTLSEFLHHLVIGEVSFWATFGWLNIVGPEWLYTFYRIISRIGLLGVALAAVLNLLSTFRQNTPSPTPTSPAHPSPLNSQPLSLHPHPSLFIPHPSSLIIHLVFPVALAFSLTRLVATEGGLQGRQLLPALGAMAMVIMSGWWYLTPGRIRLPLLGVLFALLLGLAVWLPYRVVAYEYTPRPLLAETDLPPDLPRLDLTYNDEMKLIAAQIEAETIQPGQRVPITVYWQALKPMTTNYSVFVHLFGRGYQNVGQFNTYPDLGLRPTTTLQPGQVMADTYPVLVNGGSQAPARLWVNVGLFDFYEPGRPGIQPTAADGTATSPTIGQLKLVPDQWPAPSASILAHFADNIQLSDYSLTGCVTPQTACTITLQWHALARPATDYTVFIQLWRDGQQVAGFDAPPLNNDYPTSLWDAGEVILDPHFLSLADLPPGEYQILAGLYNFTNGERLPANTSNGTPWPNYAIDLGTLTLKEP